MVRQWQELFFDKRYASTELVNPNFVKIAEGYDIEAQRVDKREDLQAAIQKMVGSKVSYFLEIIIEKEDNVFPMIPTGVSVSGVRLK
jgi:acetolactate synthase-1/2/3 large subunit